MAYSESDDVDIIQLWCDKPCKREGCPGNSWETEAVTKRLTSLCTQYCEVIKLVGCSCSRDHTAWSDSTQLSWLRKFWTCSDWRDWQKTGRSQLSWVLRVITSPDAMWSLLELNSTQLPVELSPVRCCDQGFILYNSVWRRVVGLQQLR